MRTGPESSSFLCLPTSFWNLLTSGSLSLLWLLQILLFPLQKMDPLLIQHRKEVKIERGLRYIFNLPKDLFPVHFHVSFRVLLRLLESDAILLVMRRPVEWGKSQKGTRPCFVSQFANSFF